MTEQGGPELSERIDYDGDGIGASEIAASPWALITSWVAQAQQREEASGDVPEPDALSVATVDGAGQPHVRTVLMRYLETDGPGFYTNYESRKGLDLQANPHIAAALTWPSMFRAIRFVGVAVQLPPRVSDAYFASRPWGSRIGAWASRQSAPAADRAELDEAYQQVAQRFPDHGSADDVPRPPFWGGYRIDCAEVEFWAGRRSRLHDRIVYVRTAAGGLDDDCWKIERRQP